MIINRQRVKFGISDLLIVAAAVFFYLGLKFWFPVCGGTMPCHWAGRLLEAAAVLMLVLGLVHLVVPKGAVKTGLDISLVGLTVLTANIPGNIIAICRNPDMSCRHLTLPFTITFCALFVLILIADTVTYWSLSSAEVHKRKESEKQS